MTLALTYVAGPGCLPVRTKGIVHTHHGCITGVLLVLLYICWRVSHCPKNVAVVLLGVLVCTEAWWYGCCQRPCIWI